LSDDGNNDNDDGHDNEAPSWTWISGIDHFHSFSIVL
jgi:hypothetical protein